MSNPTQSFKNPPKFGDEKNYQDWKRELELWKRVTDLPKEKQGLAVSLTLTGKAKETALQVEVEDLEHEEGLKNLLERLDTLFLRDSRDYAYEAYRQFDSAKRDEQQSISEFIAFFDSANQKCKRYDMTLPDAVLAFKLLDAMNLQQQQKQMALTACSELTYDAMKSALKRIFSDHVHQKASTEGPAIKVKEEVLYGRPKQPARRQGGKKGTNPLNKYGKRTQCRVCQSIFHWAKDCPENAEVELCEDEEENVTLLANDVLLVEARNAAVLDTGCTRTVCGEKWLKSFLNDNNTKSLRSRSCSRPFRFGAGKPVYATKSIEIPAIIGTKTCSIRTDVVPVDIPLLLSKASLKKAETILDLKNDKAVMLGQEIYLKKTSSGHYCIDIGDGHSQVDHKEGEILLVNNNLSSQEKSKIVKKLHCQFGHASAERIKQLLKCAGVNDDDLFTLLSEAVNSCETCIKYKKPSPRPVVGLPLASDFNETVAVDLHQLGPNLWYLHIIDEFTRFSSGCIMRSKKSTVFVDNFIKYWISIYGAPRKLFSDNGGEFNNDEVRDMAENFNIEVKTTAAFSPWSNGTLERNNLTLTEILLKMKSSHNLDWETALAWALNAKNSLQNVYGFSPYQLVFGRNPNLPSVLSDNPPALEGVTVSEKVAGHITALYAARAEFTKAESSEKIRRALRKQTRSIKNPCEIGNKVYYKRPGCAEWKGPGVVIGKDGSTVIVKHGGAIVRVHEVRLQKLGDSLPKIEELVETETESEGIKQTNSTAVVVDDDDNDDDGFDKPGTSNDEVDGDIQPSENSDNHSNTENDQTSISNKGISYNQLKPGQIISYRHTDDDTEVRAVVMSRGGKSCGKYNSWYNLSFTSPPEVDGAILSVDLKKVNDLRIHDTNLTDTTESVLITSDVQMGHAKLAELSSWKQNDVYTEVRDQGQKCVSTRWVCTLKNTDKGVVPKARLVARGFEEFHEEFQKDSPTCAHESLRLIIAVLAQRKWKLNSMDIKTAFLQGNPIERDVYIRPPKEANVQNTLWKLKKCVYGLSDASLNWYYRVKSVMLNNGGRISKVDPAVFYWLNDNNDVIGILACHVDDFVWGGNEQFEKVISAIRSTFNVGHEDSIVFKYCGIELHCTDDDCISLHQDKYTDNLTSIEVGAGRSIEKDSELSDSEKTSLRSKVGQLLWLAHQSRPDLLFDVSMVANNIKCCTVKDLLGVNKIITKSKLSKMSLTYQHLGDDNDLCMALFSDAALGNLPDGGSQGGYFISLLNQKTGQFSPIWWNSKKIRRVVRSTLAAETLAMSEGIDMCLFLMTLFAELMFGKPDSTVLQLLCFTDCKSLYEAVKSQKFVQEKRLRMEISGIKELIENKQIQKICWCESKAQLADCLTKRGASSLVLRKVLEQGFVDL